jgi:FkbM family methyltransferase
MQILHRLLYWPPLNALLIAFLKAIPALPKYLRIPPCGRISVALGNGKILKLNTNQTCHVTAVLAWEGSNAYEFSAIFEDLFPKIRCFFDVGSNIGYYTVMAGVCNPGLEIHAFDPSPGPFEYLQENIAINELRKAKAHQLALSDSSGRFSFHIAWNKKFPWLKFNSLGGSGHLSHVRENSTLHRVEVEVLTLDAFVEREGVQALDLIKLDVEEAEHLVLAGAVESVRTFRPIIVCEVFSGEMMQKIRDQILNQDYQAFRFDEAAKKLIPEDLQDQTFIEKIENYFFVPAEKRDLLLKYLAD